MGTCVAILFTPQMIFWPALRYWSFISVFLTLSTYFTFSKSVFKNDTIVFFSLFSSCGSWWAQLMGPQLSVTVLYLWCLAAWAQGWAGSWWRLGWPVCAFPLENNISTLVWTPHSTQSCVCAPVLLEGFCTRLPKVTSRSASSFTAHKRPVTITRMSCLIA